MANNRIVFLDYDDVVNIPIWNEKGTRARYGQPYDNKVNDFQAVQWVSEFCQHYHYDIVVTSTWRTCDNYKECLINGGLWDGIEILGRTADLWTEESHVRRGVEIAEWLADHPEVKYYIIFDDSDDFLPYQLRQQVKPRIGVGFTFAEYEQACKIAERDIGHGGSFWKEKEKHE